MNAKQKKSSSQKSDAKRPSANPGNANSKLVSPATSNSKPDQVSTQLKRIRGQVDGILKMYQDGRGCIDIVRQLVAARSSLGRVARDMLSSEVTKCTKEKKTDEIDEIFKEVFRY